MNRMIMIVVTIALMSPSAALCQVAPGGTLVPIEQAPGVGVRRAEPGEQIYLYARDATGKLAPVGVVVGDDFFTFERWQKAFAALDHVGMKELVESKKVVPLPSGTVIKVIEYQHYGVSGSPGAYALYRARIVSDGPLKDKEVMVQYTHAKFCEIVPAPKAPKAKAKRK